MEDTRSLKKEIVEIVNQINDEKVLKMIKAFSSVGLKETAGKN